MGVGGVAVSLSLWVWATGSILSSATAVWTGSLSVCTIAGTAAGATASVGFALVRSAGCIQDQGKTDRFDQPH